MSGFLFLTIPILILWSWLLPIGFGSRRIEGEVITTFHIPILSRVKRHGIHIVATLAVTSALVALELASPWWLAPALASAAGLLAMPQSYTVTTRGIRTGQGNFHRWTEFAGVHRSAAGATLQPIRRGPGLPIWLSGSREDDEFVHLLRTLIRDSYKGKPTVLPAEPADASATHLPHVAAYVQEP